MDEEKYGAEEHSGLMTDTGNSVNSLGVACSGQKAVDLIRVTVPTIT
jgi:hypothetical protein